MKPSSSTSPPSSVSAEHPASNNKTTAGRMGPSLSVCGCDGREIRPGDLAPTRRTCTPFDLGAELGRQAERERNFCDQEQRPVEQAFYVVEERGLLALEVVPEELQRPPA